MIIGLRLEGSKLKFTDIDLHPEIQAAINELGFEECTPIQEASMDHILHGKDVAGLAQTGTGKTAAFLLPIMDRILRAKDSQKEGAAEIEKTRFFPDWKVGEYILVLVPTRELADQVHTNLGQLRGNSELRGVKLFGGVSYDRQKEALAKGYEFIIATPGRLIDLYKSHQVDLKQVRAVIFDEADRMFDMGFKDDMKYILKRVPNDRQFLVFSATMNFDVLNVAYQFGADPIECNIDRDQVKAENVEDEIFHIGQEEKPKYLYSLLQKHKPKQAIVFSNFKMNVGRITRFLNANGIPAVGISSLLTQAQRNRVMAQFKGDNDQNIMVATDVAARGLDIKGVDLVVNFELPDDPENYVHRIGRTGRAGAEGKAFSLVSDRDVQALPRIEEYVKHKLAMGWLEDADIVEPEGEFPKEDRRERRGRDDKRDGKGRGDRKGGRDGKRDSRKDARGKDKDFKPRRKTRDGKREDEKEEKGTHRDRVNGRHRSRNERRKPGEKSGQKGGRRNEDKSVTQKSKAKKRRRPTSKRPARTPQKPQSIGQKVSGFFKKLFS